MDGKDICCEFPLLSVCDADVADNAMRETALQNTTTSQL